MSDAQWQLAQVNIGRARGQPTDPVMQAFVARLAEINALADQSPGFVGSRPTTVPPWRRR